MGGCQQVHLCELVRLCTCVALTVSFSGFHLAHQLICCTDQTVMLKSSLLWAAWSLLDSVLLATVLLVVVEVSDSCQNIPVNKKI